MNSFFESFFKPADFNRLTNNLLNIIEQLVILTVLFLIITKIGHLTINHFFNNKKKRSQSKLAKVIDSVNEADENRIQTIHSLVNNGFKYAMLFIYLYSALSVLGIPMGTLLAGAGILSIALGLGAQGFVTDVVSGLFIIIENQFNVTERVTIAGLTGSIKSMGIRTTVLLADDGSVNFIPNRNISNVVNQSRNNMIVTIKIPVFPSTDVKKLTKVLEDVNATLASENPQITNGPVLIGMLQTPNNSFVYQINITTTNGAQPAIKNIYTTNYLNALKKNNISLPDSSGELMPAN